MAYEYAPYLPEHERQTAVAGCKVGVPPVYDYEIGAHLLDFTRSIYPVEGICGIDKELCVVYLEKAVAVVLLLLMKKLKLL